MNPNERKEEAQALAALYALGVLDQQDVHMFETDLVGEIDGTDEDLVVFEFIVAAIGLSAPEKQPSPSVRERLSARVAAFTERKRNPIVVSPARYGCL